MSISNLETRMTEYMFHTLKEQGSRSLNPHSGSPLLYLKCGGSDYPYLREVEPQRRCLPVLLDSAAEHLIRRSRMLFGSK
jgi:hypothetical protein